MTIYSYLLRDSDRLVAGRGIYFVYIRTDREHNVSCGFVEAHISEVGNLYILHLKRLCLESEARKVLLYFLFI